jgi:hypothetical protein
MMYKVVEDPVIRRRLRSLLATFSCVALLTAATAAGAQGGESPEQLFEQGKAAMGRGDFAAACSAFRRSYEQSQSKGALYNLALCEDEGKNGKLATSLRHWRMVQDRYRDQPEVMKEADKRVQALEGRVARLTLRRAAGAPADMQVSLEGQSVPLDTAIPVDAGRQLIRATAAGHESRTLDLYVRDGEKLSIDIDPGRKGSVQVVDVPPDAAAPPPPGGSSPPAPPPSGGSPWTTAGYVAGGVGLAGVLLFAISAPIILSAESDLKDACSGEGNTDCGQEAAAIAEDGEAWVVPNAIGFVTGVVGLGLGVTFLVVGSQDDGAEMGMRGDRIELRGRF